jgi:Protein of unknown function (DUF3592)
MPVEAKIIFVLFGAALVATALLLHLRDRYRISAAIRWPIVEARILMSAVATHETGESVIYQPDIRYAYRVGGHEHEGERVKLLDDSRTARRSKVDAIVNRYPVGAAVAVRYDPTKPGCALLELDTPPIAHLWLGALGFGFIVLPLLV